MVKNIDTKIVVERNRPGTIIGAKGYRLQVLIENTCFPSGRAILIGLSVGSILIPNAV